MLACWSRQSKPGAIQALREGTRLGQNQARAFQNAAALLLSGQVLLLSAAVCYACCLRVIPVSILTEADDWRSHDYVVNPLFKTVYQ